MLKKPDLCCKTSVRQPAGGTTKLRQTFGQAFTRKEKMTNYVSFLLETDAAKRRVSELFGSETLRRPDYRSAIGSCAGTCAAEQCNNPLPEYGSTRTPVRGRTRTETATLGADQTKGDLTVFGFMLALVLVGVVLAIHTDRPVLWLLIGPAPLVVLHTVRMFLRWRVIRREGLLTFCERERR
jgi:hypothetical protein